ncbi:sugar transferase [Candidatus Methylacidiphilum infernorum]|uniref:Sugar transferase n=1 Tax=Candidatus Methylacidiphilum infernorum TaxID=511746 RepID=A0ABX7PTV4_9BACT|nr:sugar transferase [Candidatus Methylacidiphilum infernorum]QSR86422.1 sugar transferase [Candidatus Methylacidiphilum infernorum]
MVSLNIKRLNINPNRSLWPWKGKWAIVFDFLFLLGASALVYWVRYSTIYWPKNLLPLLSHRHTALFILYGLISLLILHQKGIYDPRNSLNTLEETKKIFWGLTQAAALLVVILFAGQIYISRKLLLVLWLASLVILPGWRYILKKFYSGDLKEGNPWIRTVIVGEGEIVKKIEKYYESHPFLGISSWGVISPTAQEPGHRIEDLPQVLDRYWIDEIVICCPLPLNLTESIVLEAVKRKKRVKLAFPSLSENLHPHWENMEFCDGFPLVPLCDKSIPLFHLFVKRLIDLLVSFFGLIALSPLFLLLGIMIKLQDGGPIFYCSTRIGRKGRKFPCLKFRTMSVDADKKKEELAPLNERIGPMFKITNDPRITPLGKFLRKYSLDELPQLFNVLWGQMSLVGPRPPTPDEVEKYENYSLSYYRRLEVKPGITSLWAVEARNDPDFRKAIELDCKYIEEWTPWLDFKILLKTIPAVLRGEGK